MEKKLTFIILLLLILLGAYIRTSGTIDGYFAFTFDQGRDLLQVKHIVDNLDLQLIGPPSGIEGVFHGVWWYWLLVPIYLFAQGDPLCIVLIFDLLMTLCIPVAFLLGRSIFGKKVGLVCACFVAFSPFFISTAAQLWNPNVVPLLVLLFLISLYRFIDHKSSIMWVSLCLGAIFEFHIGFGFMLLVASGMSLLLYKYFFHLKNLGLFIVGILFWVTPRMLFDVTHGFLQSKSVINYLSNPKTVHTSLGLVDRLGDRLLSLYVIFNETMLGKNENVIGLVLLTLTFACLILTFRGAKNARSSFFGLMCLILVLFFIIASIYPDALWGYYLIGVPSLMLPFVGLMSWRVIKLNKYVGAALTIFVVGRLAFPLLFTGNVWEGDASVYKNQQKVVDEIYKDLHQETFNVAVYTPSLIDYNYQYLFSHYARINGLPLPDRQNIQTTAYFIIEPDPWNKGLRDVWIRDRVGDGRIEWKRDLVGGIVVEKRVRE